MIYCTHVTFSATTENRTSPEYHRSMAKDQRGPFWYEQGGSLQGGWGDRNGHECSRFVETTSRQEAGSLTICTSLPGLWLPFVSAPVASTGTSILGPLPHLSSFALQPAHALLPPLRSHGADVSQKMALRPRAMDNESIYNSDTTYLNPLTTEGEKKMPHSKQTKKHSQHNVLPKHILKYYQCLAYCLNHSKNIFLGLQWLFSVLKQLYLL